MTVISDDDFVRLVQRRGGLKEDGVAGAATVALTDRLLPPQGEAKAFAGILSDDAFVRLWQLRGGLVLDGWAGHETLALVDRLLPVVAPIKIAIPDDYWPMLSKIESGDRPYVKAKTSSASGLYQFIKATWEGEGGSWGANKALAFGGLRPSEAEQLQRAKTFTAKNARYLKEEGLPINRASLYASHFFGPLTAARVIKADVKARADSLAGAAATKANPTILRGKTVGEFLTWLHRKTGEWAR